MDPPLHPAVASLSFLLGKWRGEGEGFFPTINSFRYGEEIQFSHSGKVSARRSPLLRSEFQISRANRLSHVRR